MKKIILFLALILTSQLSILNCQATNVSGGIYTNTTWTYANSPYIVTDTVVVFPGVTLTIEAGVVVKFADSMRLEIRQSSIIAIGTMTDSITFTSNSSTPIPGIYRGIYFNQAVNGQFNFCNVYYAYCGMDGAYNISLDSCYIKNSIFANNIEGFSIAGFVDSCLFYNDTLGCVSYDGNINHSSFINNSTGLTLIYGSHNVSNSLFRMNQIGIDNNASATSFNNCSVNNNQTGANSSYSDLHFNNCIIDSNSTGLICTGTVLNCIIKYNQHGLLTGSCTIQNTVIDSNTIEGIHINNGVDSILHCEIKYNGIGVNETMINYPNVIAYNVIESNDTGFVLNSAMDTIYCNKICNNSSLAIQYTLSFNSNASLKNNYWCSTDSATIHSHIYDGYTNISLGLVSVFPIDTQNCYLSGCNLQLSTTAINATCGTCANGSAHVSMSNGFAPYTFTWNSSPIQTTQTAVNLLPGTYTVCVIDANGCTACHSVYVDSTNCTSFAIATSVTNATCSTCLDGTGTVVATGGTTPYLYSWYTSPFQSTSTATGLLQGTYQVCVSDAGGCHLCDSVTIGTGNCSAHFDLYPDTNILHHYFAVNMASGVPPLTYDWNWGDNSTHDFTPYPSHQYANAGAYNICLSITDSVGCTNTFCCNYYLMRLKNTIVSINVVHPNFTTGIIENPMLNYCTIVPNPFHDKTTIIIQGNTTKETALIIYDLFGREVKSTVVGTNKQFTIDAGDLQQGMYFYKLVDNSGALATGKLVIQ